MSEQNKKISCFKCRNFQLSTLIFSLLVVLTTIIVFVPITIDIEIEGNFLSYAMMYGLAFALIGLLTFGSLFSIKSYCDEQQEHRDVGNLVIGFIFAFAIFLILIVIIIYMPASIEEYPIKLLDKDLQESAIQKLSCRTFEMGFDEYLNSYRLYIDGNFKGFNSTGTIFKHALCLEEKQ